VTLARARTAAKLPEATTPHSLRDYYASLLIRQGLSVKAVQLRVGHAGAKTTLDRYARLWPGDDEQTRDAVTPSPKVSGTRRTTGVSIAENRCRA
jgi:integrase